jgi:hypothetical protein
VTRQTIILFFALFITLASCDDSSSEEVNPTKNEGVEPKSTTVKNSTWRNPMITPFGKDIVSVIRGYFLVGDFDKMLQFVFCSEEKDISKIKLLLQRSSWGYELKVTNVTWESDSTFRLTLRTNIQNTVGVEQYQGVIQQDTAKLILIPISKKLFVK